MDENIATVLEVVADAIPDAVALVEADRSVTWSQVDTRAARLATFLADHGVTEGSVVAIGVRNRIEHVEALVAAVKLRATPANLNYRYRDAEIHHVLEDCAATAVIGEADVSGRVRAVRGRLPSLRCIVDVADVATSSDIVTVDDAISTSVPATRRVRHGDDRFIIYTGGTTGQPKATWWRQSRLGVTWDANFLAAGHPVPSSLDELAATVRRLAAGPRSTALPACPLIHATGLHTAMGTLVSGGVVVMPPGGSFDPAAVWATVERHRVTTMTIVGDAFARPLLDELRRADAERRAYDLTTLTRVASSGVTWSAEVKAGLLDYIDARLVDVVASSEGGPYAISETRRGTVAPTSRFVLAPFARVIDDDGADIEPGSGRVGWLASSNVSAPDGYLADDAASQRTWKTIDGVRHAVPGDRAVVESDGSLVLLGRDSSIINTGGEKVFAEEVENVLVSHPAVADVLVAPAPDERWGSVVTAIVQVEHGQTVDDAELAAHVQEHLAGYKQPRRFTFVPSIQRSAAGKADRRWAATVAATVAADDLPTATAATTVTPADPAS